MDLLLLPHPARPAKSVHRLAVSASRRGDRLILHYTLTGNISNLLLPALERAERGTRLWEHTCFEAFVRQCEFEGQRNSDPYLEFNFSPSGRWAAYEFGGVRTGMRDAQLEQPQIEIWSDSDALNLKAEVAGLTDDGPWKLGLSAVVEEASTDKSYWALVHPSAKPDFHHPGSFVLTLP